MKKLLTAALLLLGLGQSATAQEVYNEVLAKAEAVVNDPKSDEVSLKIAHFKSTALRYLRTTALQKNEDVTTFFLDTQAYYMSDFLGRFFADLARHQNDSETDRKATVLRYVNASVGNPLFEDVDEETAEIFIEDKGNLTPFSLNTNWEKACQALDYLKEEGKL